VDIVGEAGPIAVRTPSGGLTYVSGVVYLDRWRSRRSGFAWVRPPQPPWCYTSWGTSSVWRMSTT